jgi:hypothetical protein
MMLGARLLGTAVALSLPAAREALESFLYGVAKMSDAKQKAKDAIDSAAEKAKEVAGKAVDKSKEAAKTVGEKVKDVGQSIKKQGS